MATPTVLLFVVGLIVLRLFPPAMRALARLASPWRSLTLLLGAWYLGRTPTHYGRTVLLLAIAGALAVFAASFRTTLDTSYDDRALHAVGASVRLSEPWAEWLPFEQIEELTGQPAARVQRVLGAFAGDEDSGRIQVAALDAETLARQFDERGIEWALPPEQLAAIAPPLSDAPRAVIDDFGGRLVLRLDLVSVQQETPIGVKLLDANGRYWWYSIDTLSPPPRAEGAESDEQEPEPLALTLSRRLTQEADAYLPLEGARIVQQSSAFRPGVSERPAAPLTLVSVDLALTRAPGEIVLRDLSYERRDESQLLADFRSGEWEATPLEVGEQPLDFFVIEGDEDGARYRWNAIPASLRGVRYVADREPLPALLSLEAMQQGRLQVGETVRIRVGPTPMRFLVVGQFETFPTYDPQRDDPLVIVDRAALVERLYGSAAAGVALAVANELWVAAPLVEWSPLLEATIAQGDPATDDDEQERSSSTNTRTTTRSAGGSTTVTVTVTRSASGSGSDESSVAELEQDESAAQPLAIEDDLGAVATLESARAELAADPLIVASWNGVFIGALAAVAIASAFGLVVLTAVTAQARRVEFAVCQSVGMSMRQILGLIALEQLIVIAIGLGAGPDRRHPGGRDPARLLRADARRPRCRAGAAVHHRLARRGHPVRRADRPVRAQSGRLPLVPAPDRTARRAASGCLTRLLLRLRTGGSGSPNESGIGAGCAGLVRAGGGDGVWGAGENAEGAGAPSAASRHLPHRGRSCGGLLRFLVILPCLPLRRPARRCLVLVGLGCSMEKSVRSTPAARAWAIGPSLRVAWVAASVAVWMASWNICLATSLAWSYMPSSRAIMLSALMRT